MTHSLSLVLLGGALLLGASSPAAATDPAPASAGPAAPPSLMLPAPPANGPAPVCPAYFDPARPSGSALLGGAGLRVHIDPATGKPFTPPAAERAVPAGSWLERAMSSSGAGLEEVRLPNGAVRVNLQGRFMNALFATIGPDGKLVVGHEPPASLAGAAAGASAAEEAEHDAP
jgi:hypothetical protein